MIRGISSLDVRSDNEEIVCGNLQVLVHLRELDSGLAAPAIRVVEQDTLPAIVDDVVVRVLRLASDREEAALEPYRMARLPAPPSSAKTALSR